jgi:hypothetical protein
MMKKVILKNVHFDNRWWIMGWFHYYLLDIWIFAIHVSNLKNGWIIIKIEQKYTTTPLNLVYGNNHFEPAEINSEIKNVPIHIHNDEK